MLKIKKLRADHVIDFAAEELKKYLRMMMPECGDVEILYAPGAEDGFRLGLAEDFGLTFPEAEDPEQIWQLKRRIAELSPILTQMNELAELTAHYYDRGYYRSGKYTL